MPGCAAAIAVKLMRSSLNDSTSMTLRILALLPMKRNLRDEKEEDSVKIFAQVNWD